LNKENLALKESEEGSDEDDDVGDADTLRRTSRATVITATDVSESIEEGTEYSGTEDYEESETDGPEVERGHVVLYDEGRELA